MTIGISLNVDARQLQSARKDVIDTSRALEELEKHSKFKIDIEGDTDLNERLHEMVETMRSMQGLSGKGSRQGGRFDTAQKKEWLRLEEQQKTNADAYEKVLTKIGTQLDGLYAKKKKLEAVPLSKSEEWTKAQTELASLNKELDARTAGYEKLQGKYDPRYNRILNRSGRMSNDVTGYGDMPGNQDQATRSLGSTIKTAVAFGVAAAGILTPLAVIAAARSQYRQFLSHEDPLFARGVRGITGGAGSAAGLGIDPLEHYALMEQLSHDTGLNSTNGIGRVSRMAELFAKSQGLSLSEAGGFGASVYRATGDNSTLPTTALAGIMTQGIDKSRMPETMRLVEGHLRKMSEAAQGAGLNNSHLATALALASITEKQKDSSLANYMKGESFGGMMQNGLQGAGSPAGEIAIAKAIGMFDGPMTFSKIHEMNILRQGGFMERPDLMKKLMGRMPGGLDAGGRAGWLESMFPDWSKGRGTDKLLQLFDPQKGLLKDLDLTKGNLEKQLEMMGKGGSREHQLAVSEALRQIRSNPAFDRQSANARAVNDEIMGGSRIDKLILPLTKAALEGAEGILGSSFGKQLTDAVEKFSKAVDKFAKDPSVDHVAGIAETVLTGKTTPYKRAFFKYAKGGVQPSLLEAIAEVESGFKTNAVSRKGAKGIMQLMPETAKAYGVDPNNPEDSIRAAGLYMEHLLKKYKGSIPKALAAFNMGEHKFDKYGFAGGGKETTLYEQKVDRAYFKRTGEHLLEEPNRHGGKAVDKISKSFAGLLTDSSVSLLETVLMPLKYTLDRIADNTTPHQKVNHLPTGR